MRFFKLNLVRQALLFSVVALIVHLGIGFLLAALIKNQVLSGIWQRSLKVYWPAMDLVQFLKLNVNKGVLISMGAMILAALLEWWVIFLVGIWLVRICFRKPPISNVSKITVTIIGLAVAVCFYKMSPEAFGDPRSPLERAIVFNDTNAVEKILKSNPSLANKSFRFGNETPLFRATICNNPKANIDLLVKNGADINAKSGGFNLTPLQQAAWGGKIEAVKALLALKPDVNATTESGDTALTYAFVAGSKEIFNLLLDNGADINHGRSALAGCMIYGSGKDSWPEFLLSKGADPNRKGTDADRFVPIIQAIIGGKTNYVAALLKYHVDLNTRYINGADNFSPLELAMDEGHLDIAFMLQNYVLQSRSNTVSFAAANGNLDAIRSFLQKSPQSIEEKDELGFTPLAWAAKTGQKDAVSLLLSFGANPNATNSGGRYPIDWAATSGHLPVVELLSDKTSNDQNITLFLAVQQQQVSVVKFLLEHGANPNIHFPAGNSEAPLHIAARLGNVEAAKLLLAHGAHVNELEQNGWTPLQCAVSGTSKGMIELLFTNGASVQNAHGWTVFQIWSLGAGDTNIAVILLAHGANINAKDHEGKIALHFAVQQGTLQSVEWLLKNGAEVNARDNKGVTPLSLTKYRNRGREVQKRKDLAELLRKYGAN
ncbi:MAG: ankyrin repeat domain-containing protein [Verrucomicrobiota bacterium]